MIGFRQGEPLAQFTEALRAIEFLSQQERVMVKSQPLPSPPLKGWEQSCSALTQAASMITLSFE